MQLSRRLLLGAIGTLPLARVALGQVAHRLTILHLNDFHSRHGMVDGRAMACSAGAACFGSSPLLAAAIREQRAAAQADGRTVVLLDAGDQFQGSLFFTAHEGMAELAVQHAVGTDAMALGNHEFDKGPAVLGRYVAAARFPVLSANLDFASEPALAGRVRPWAMLERGGLRIGVVGLTTAETRTSSSPGPNVVFGEPGPALTRAAAEARAAGATLVVALSHLGLPLDRRLDVPGVAAVIGGHTHTLLSNDEAGAAGPHPVVSRHGALIVQAGCYGRYLGRLDLELTGDGTVVAYGGGCRHVGPELTPDAEVAGIVTGFAAPLEALRRRMVAVLPEALDVGTCRVGPCAFGTLAAEAVRRAAHGGAVGLMNAGGLRVGLPAGPVSLGQVLDAMPFGNTLATVTVSGEALRAAALHGVTMAGRGGFAQWAGLRMRPGMVVIEVQGADGTWAPLDPAGRYLVATNDFVRGGGDGYSMLRDGEDAYDSGPAIADLVAEALASPPR